MISTVLDSVFVVLKYMLRIRLRKTYSLPLTITKTIIWMGIIKIKVKNAMFEMTNGIYFIEYVSANIFGKYVKETKILTKTCETQ